MIKCMGDPLTTQKLLIGHFSVRQKNFHVESNVYTKGEVVAMEWLVQEVLNFQCFLPTIYNFLWYVTIVPLLLPF